MLKQVINMATIQEIKRKKGDSAFFVVIPLPYIKGFSWKRGDVLEWKITGKDRLKLERKKPLDAKSTPRLYKHEEEGDYDCQKCGHSERETL